MIRTERSDLPYFPYTTEQLLSLAENDHFVRTSRNFAIAYRWHRLATSSEAFWGEFPQKDSFFKTLVHKDSLQTSCDCSSQLRPCQHALALMLLFQEQPELFELRKSPEVIPEFQGPKQSSKNLNLVELQEGLALLENWLHDLVKVGLEQARTYPVMHWQAMADRLVDARLASLADDVRRWGQKASEDIWAETMLARMGRLQLLIEGFKRFDDLPESTQADLLLAVGRWPPKGELLKDSWVVLARRRLNTAGRKRLRVWLQGRESGRFALIDMPVAKPDSSDKSLLVGLEFAAALRFFEGSTPYLASIEKRESFELAKLKPHGESSIKEVLEKVAAMKAQNPWLTLFPSQFSNLSAVQIDSKWFLQDEEGSVLPLPPKLASRWHLRAMNLAEPLSIFLEWDSQVAMPLSVWADERLLDLRLCRGGNL